MSNPHVKNHVKLQNSVSYETRMKENTGFTKKSARYSNRVKKEKARKERKRNKRNEQVKSLQNKK
jgi:hypothetical protein